MPRLHICPLSHVAQVLSEVGPSCSLSLIRQRGGTILPAELAQTRHLHLSIDDIEQPETDCIYPQAEHVQQIIDFLRAWDGSQPILIHCWQGISRSAAAGLILLALQEPGREAEQALRLHQCMPFARPNRRLLSLADDLLGRGGRITAMAEPFKDEERATMGRPIGLAVKAD